ncbi:hypothetical protein ILUMI_19454 [Ignelater luminosus]|uniref:Serpin domain-containing protein n=1 Tax=Ignelater luminosus TaxID=2038154 RepID=A0A8K0CG64_IGNLU|nr:hypothetical protein ILUMI_19454 [Ignelater luminosus]
MEVTNANNQFANKLYKAISKITTENVFFSPLSVHTVLSMVYQGAAKETAECLGETIGVPTKELAANGYNTILNMLNNVDNVALHAANKIYVKEGYPLKSEFQKATAELFVSKTESVDFENGKHAAESINSWVEDKTNKKIKDIVSPNDLDRYTRLILLNAIYFKGNWDKQFQKENTNTETFYITSNKKIDCQMMHITQHYYYYEDEQLDARILEMKYVNQNISTVVILPNTIDGIGDLDNKIVDADLSAITQKAHPTKVKLSLPKFKIETCMNLKPLLKKIGLGIIFDENRADFSEISESDEKLYVSQVIQKAFLEVNEEGSEAAAVTMLKICKKKCIRREPEPIIFIVDHPFIILLQIKDEDSKNTLFYGKIVDPCY